MTTSSKLIARGRKGAVPSDHHPLRDPARRASIRRHPRGRGREDPTIEATAREAAPNGDPGVVAYLGGEFAVDTGPIGTTLVVALPDRPSTDGAARAS